MKQNNKKKKLKLVEPLTENQAKEKFNAVVKGAEGGETDKLLETNQQSEDDPGKNGSSGGTPTPIDPLDDSVPPGPPSTLTSILSALKILVLVVLITYMWIRNHNMREESKALLKFLQHRNQIPLLKPEAGIEMPVPKDV